MHFAQGKVVELEAQLGRDETVAVLLMRQGDVHADVGHAHIMGAAVGGFHDAGAAAGADVEALLR
ncbi:hypothetical protein D3C87_2110730 [compost metagenome]